MSLAQAEIEDNCEINVLLNVFDQPLPSKKKDEG